jgi:hypothetical protein
VPRCHRLLSYEFELRRKRSGRRCSGQHAAADTRLYPHFCAAGVVFAFVLVLAGIRVGRERLGGHMGDLALSVRHHIPLIHCSCHACHSQLLDPHHPSQRAGPESQSTRWLA